MSTPRPGWQLRPHGTSAAYRRHYRYGQEPCEACKQAESLRHAARPDRAAEYAARRDRYRTARDAGIGSRKAKAAMGSAARFEQLMAGVS